MGALLYESMHQLLVCISTCSQCSAHSRDCLHCNSNEIINYSNDRPVGWGGARGANAPPRLTNHAKTYFT